ncbi:type IVB secretion system protein IcmH/DotU [Inquilinus sp. CA228]|uniref:type IVB secretion system protein IcmH/DotU n=1 Tax=Inquilinus sp. CA228 TaxID=3455609 RepID=UPI003F8D523E
MTTGASPIAHRRADGTSISGDPDRLAFAAPSHSLQQQHEAPIVAAAMPLLLTIIGIARVDTPPDLDSLRYLLAQQIVQFERIAIENGCPADDVFAARYILCSALDEAVVSTSWADEARWSRLSLLSEFHGETTGGEKVFSLLDRLRQDPARYPGLLELGLLVLGLGFEGKYRIQPNGRLLLQNYRSDLARAVAMISRRQTGFSPPPLPSGRLRKLRAPIPLWVVAVLTAVIILLIYAGFETGLMHEAQPLIHRLDSSTF